MFKLHCTTRPTTTRGGFTLLEILIVISIILIVGVMGAASYTLARRGIAIDLQSDKLVVTMNKLRDEAKISAKCTGIAFANDSAPQLISGEYVKSSRACDGVRTKSPISGWPSDISVTAINTDSLPTNELEVIFVPPRGVMQIEPAARNVEIQLTFTKTSEPVSRIISISKDSGTIEKHKINHATSQ